METTNSIDTTTMYNLTNQIHNDSNPYSDYYKHHQDQQQQQQQHHDEFKLSFNEFYEPDDSTFQQSEKLFIPQLDLDLDSNLTYQHFNNNELCQSGSSRSDSSDSSLPTPDPMTGPTSFNINDQLSNNHSFTSDPLSNTTPFPTNLMYNQFDLYSNPTANLFDFNPNRYPTTYSDSTSYPDPTLLNYPLFPMGLTLNHHPFLSKSLPSPSKRYRCNMCGKGFSRPSSLTTHTYSHTGEKPFKCHVQGCGRQFSVVSNLRRHGKVHEPQP